MQPKQFDAGGFVSGRFVREGEVIGKVSNYFKRERDTTYHLHFDVQVPTKYGWVFVNPYMTLVAAYERQIRGRGQEIKHETIKDGTIKLETLKQPTADEPTASVAAPQQSPSTPAMALGQQAPIVAAPSTVAAKPTEIRVELPPSVGGDAKTVVMTADGSDVEGAKD
jgi:hypothetical protein